MGEIKIIKRGKRQAEAAATSTAQALGRKPAQLKREMAEVITGWVEEWREQKQHVDAWRKFADLFRPPASGCEACP